jgi:hypothetical protein
MLSLAANHLEGALPASLASWVPPSDPGNHGSRLELHNNTCLCGTVPSWIAARPTDEWQSNTGLGSTCSACTSVVNIPATPHPDAAGESACLPTPPPPTPRGWCNLLPIGHRLPLSSRNVSNKGSRWQPNCRRGSHPQPHAYPAALSPSLSPAGLMLLKGSVLSAPDASIMSGVTTTWQALGHPCHQLDPACIACSAAVPNAECGDAVGNLLVGSPLACCLLCAPSFCVTAHSMAGMPHRSLPAAMCHALGSAGPHRPLCVDG